MAKNLFMVQFLQIIGMKSELNQIAYGHLPSEDDGLEDPVLLAIGLERCCSVTMTIIGGTAPKPHRL